MEEIPNCDNDDNDGDNDVCVEEIPNATCAVRPHQLVRVMSHTKAASMAALIAIMTAARPRRALGLTEGER